MPQLLPTSQHLQLTKQKDYIPYQMAAADMPATLARLLVSAIIFVHIEGSPAHHVDFSLALLAPVASLRCRAAANYTDDGEQTLYSASRSSPWFCLPDDQHTSKTVLLRVHSNRRTGKPSQQLDVAVSGAIACCRSAYVRHTKTDWRSVMRALLRFHVTWLWLSAFKNKRFQLASLASSPGKQFTHIRIIAAG